MAIKTVLRMGDPLLLEKAQPIMQFNTPELHALIMICKIRCKRWTVQA